MKSEIRIPCTLVRCDSEPGADQAWLAKQFAGLLDDWKDELHDTAEDDLDRLRSRWVNAAEFGTARLVPLEGCEGEHVELMRSLSVILNMAQNITDAIDGPLSPVETIEEIRRLNDRIHEEVGKLLPG